MRISILLLCTLFLFFSCKQEKCEIPQEIAAINVKLEARRLEQDLFKCKSKEEVLTFIRQNRRFVDQFLQAKQYPSENELADQLFRMVQEPSLQQLVKETGDRFKDFNVLEEDLTNAYKHLKHYYPEAKVPQLTTFVTGMGQDLYLSDSLLVWGLEFFIGPKAKYRPQMPAYILYRYDKEYLVPTTVLLLSGRYVKTDLNDNSMLSEMIANGKSLYFTERLLPCTPDSLIMGYTNQQMADVYYNQERIWGHFVEKGLLFETEQFKIKKYVGERPNVPEIGKQCPGRVGMWVGWQIVRKYMEEHPEVTLQQLMAETNARKILNESKYKPKKP